MIVHDELLLEADADLDLVIREVGRWLDLDIIETHRSVERQKQLFAQGVTRIDGVTRLSAHNYVPSRAVDIAPHPVSYASSAKSVGRWYQMIGALKQAAQTLRASGAIAHGITSGGDWDSDNEFGDQNFDDLSHVELVGWEDAK